MRIIAISFGLLLLSCRSEEFKICTDERPLKEFLNYPLGVAYEPMNARADSAYEYLSDRHFKQWTPENVFKWSALSFLPGQYDWLEADAWVEEGRAKGKLLHGHTLIWYKQQPDWLSTISLSKKGWEELLRSHIRAVLSRYKGKFRSWDVVNEAFLEDGSLRPCVWLTQLGAEYLFIAYEEAAKADPAALLFYNDFGLEDNPAKLSAVLRWVSQLRERGLRIDGIGLQMHLFLFYPDAARMGNTFFRIADAGLKLHLSELDIAISDQLQPNELADKRLLVKQAERYKEVLRMYNSLPTKAKFGITLWGVSDKYSWLRVNGTSNESPLLWDDLYQPKPAYCAFIN